jgi:hypothetical protein
VVHAAFNVSDFARLATIPAIAADAIEEVGPHGIELGLHGLGDAELRHDLERRWSGAPAIGTRSPREPNKITKPRPAGVVRPIHPEVELIPLALEAEHVTVASIGECHGRDEVPHALIVSLAELLILIVYEPFEVRMFWVMKISSLSGSQSKFTARSRVRRTCAHYGKRRPSISGLNFCQAQRQVDPDVSSHASPPPSQSTMSRRVRAAIVS